MIAILAFALGLVAVGVWSLKVGGGPEKVAALMMALAYVVSAVLPYTPQNQFGGLFVGMFEVDTALFAGLFALAIMANRFWPLWLAGLQLLTLGVHLSKQFEPAILPIVYARVSERIGFVMLALLAIGILRLRARTKLPGEELDWTRPRW